MKLVVHSEGGTRLVVPSVSVTADPPPTSPVFFNPAAALNRDVSVAIAAATRGRTFCDSMAGVGARGIRLAHEVGRIETVTLVDFNRGALALGRKSARLNRVLRKCEFSESETSSYLFSRYGREARFDYVDVDPFGTPVGQLQGALRATADGGLLSLTATDTAVLCGVYPDVALRRYGATPLNNHFSHETAIRVLAGAAARTAASLDIGVEPVAAHSTRHYVRLYVGVEIGASRADAALQNVGHLSWCPSCGHAQLASKDGRTCAKCGRRAKVAGPLWVGGLTSPPTVESARGAAARMKLAQAANALGELEGIEGFPPWSFSIEKICSVLKVATVPESLVMLNLRNAGFRSMRTPFEKTGVKTDADAGEVMSAVEASAAVLRRSGGRWPQLPTPVKPGRDSGSRP